MYLPENDAYDYAQDNADTLVAIESHPNGMCRVRLEGDPDIDPELGPPLAVWFPELPEGLQRINEKLATIKVNGRKVWPDMSPFWVKTIALCYFANRKNQLFRVGRRGGKSSSICRVAIYEATEGEHEIPMGDTGVFAIISALLPQAKDRIKTLTDLCDALDIEYKPTLTTISFKKHRTEIRCFAATKEAVVSFTCIGAICDEEALWTDEDGSNPAAYILENLRPTTATMPHAKLWHISAPWSTLDIHYQAFEKGLQPDQICFYAPTWEANPTITEEGTHLLEPDEPTWERQYKAIPAAADESKFFNAALIDAAKLVYLQTPEAETRAGADLAFRKDSAALAVVSGSEAFVRLEHEKSWTPSKGLPLRPTEVITDIVTTASSMGCESICADLHYIESVREETDLTDVTLLEFPTDPERIGKAYVRLRIQFARGMVDLSKASDKLIAQLKETTVIFTVNGMHVKNPRSKALGHGDIVSALVAGAYALGGTVMPGKAVGGKRRMQSARHTPGEGEWSDLPPDD
jgi:hypothetical protein